MNKSNARSIPKTFDSLTTMRPLRPIRNESDLDAATQILDRLAVLDRRTRDQEDYLQTLSLLVETYEERNHAIQTNDLDPLDLLRSLMEARDMSASDLGRLLGNRSLGAAILRGDRQLSKSNIMSLCKHFAVGPELFLRPVSRARKAG